MTRDTQAFQEDQENEIEAEVYASLWATAPRQRLPSDAPDDLKKLTIDIDDPKRIYAIRHAARRHYFHILVERYIIQIRYGCQNLYCTTTTCFSCRRRLAGGAPVRRYNGTSARTLAIYLASQDNPEKGLCNHPTADPAITQLRKPLKVTASKTSLVEPKSNSSGSVVVSRPCSNEDIQDSEAMKENMAEASSRHSTPNVPNGNDGQSKKERISAERTSTQANDACSAVKGLREHTTTDHRSFVQNVFGTAAFKIMEWITPRNLEIVARNEVQDSVPPAEEKPPSRSCRSPPHEDGSTSPKERSRAAPKEQNGDWDTLMTVPTPISGLEENISARNVVESPRQATLGPYPMSPAAGEATVNSTALPKASPNPPATQYTSTGRRKPEMTETELPKGILSLPTSPRKTDYTPEIMPLSREPILSKPKRKLSGQAIITSPKMKIATNNATAQDLESLPTTAITAPESEIRPSQKIETRKKVVHNEEPSTSSHQTSGEHQHSTPPTSTIALLPQSISYFRIEAFDFACDVLQSDHTYEKHNLEPQVIGDKFKKNQDGLVAWYRKSQRGPKCSYSSSLKQEWRRFLEQSIFDVLSKPGSLIQSFSCKDQRLLDSQTIWYLMLRLTRVAPSLVFDSLWLVAGNLFKPPEKLEIIHDWAKDSPALDIESSQALSNVDASKVMNICLHALVAAAPLIRDARQLANMSRIRSYGLAMLGRESSALEPMKLCLQYEDVFTNELALRLARRLFSAISTRRRYTELMDIQHEMKRNETSEIDVLEIVVGMWRTSLFQDLGEWPNINLADQELIGLHDKRLPTLIIDWARAVMLQDWEGAAEVPSDGPFGGALAMMAAIYANRKTLLLGDIHFRTEFFAQRLDSVEMPVEWLSFESTKRTQHLLDHPYLFNPSTLVTYFRAINYSRMNQAYEAAKCSAGFMRSFSGDHQLMPDLHIRQKLYDRLHTATSKFLVLHISRTSVISDAFNALWRREERELMRPLKIKLGEELGEEGLDSGGVQQEFFRLAIAEALNPDYGVFTIDNRTKMTWFQPGSPEPLWKLELIGMIVSLAIYNGLTLPVTFPKALYRKLLGEDVNELHHISDGWPDLTSGLTALLEWDEKDGLVEDIFTRTYEFSVEQFGQPISRDMGTSCEWPQWSDSGVAGTSGDMEAPLVTNENRNSYVSDYIRWLTDVSVQPQFEAFKAGFFRCVDRRSITLFDPDTLQSVVEGIQDIDIGEMRRAARYIGWDASHKSVKDFWSIAKRYDLEQKRRLLEFVTASDRVPVGGMRNLQFTLQRNGTDDGHLPSSYTCYGILLLPEYSTKEVLRAKMAMALENSKGFGFA